jgi:hypothetical protein
MIEARFAPTVLPLNCRNTGVPHKRALAQISSSGGALRREAGVECTSTGTPRFGFPHHEQQPPVFVFE